MLSGLTGLTGRDLAGNEFTDISPLSGLTSLSDLGLARAGITDISVLSGLTSLTELDLVGNEFTDVSPLIGLTSLLSLDLSVNPDFRNIQPLLDNPGLGVGDYVALWGTGVTCEDVALLRAKGVDVFGGSGGVVC